MTGETPQSEPAKQRPLPSNWRRLPPERLVPREYVQDAKELDHVKDAKKLDQESEK